MYDYYNKENTNISQFSTVLVSTPALGSTSSITLSDIKAHLRMVPLLDSEWINGDTEDAYIAQCVFAASTAISNFIRMPMMRSTYRVTLDTYKPGLTKFVLPIPFVRSVTSLKYAAVDLTLVDISPITYTVFDEFCVINVPASDNVVTYIVEFTCGYDSTLQMPYDYKQMILTLAAQYYEHRGDIFLREAIDWPFYHNMVALVRYPDHWYQSGLMLNTRLDLPNKEVM